MGVVLGGKDSYFEIDLPIHDFAESLAVMLLEHADINKMHRNLIIE